MAPRWAYILVTIMFSINIMFIGFGLAPITNNPIINAEYNPVSQNVNDFEGVELDSATEGSSSVNTLTDESTQNIKFGISDIVRNGKLLLNLIVNTLTGYLFVFNMLNMPGILIYLFATIISLAQIWVIIDLLTPIISAIRGLIPI